MTIYSFAKTSSRICVLFFGFLALPTLLVYRGTLTVEGNNAAPKPPTSIIEEQSGTLVVRAGSALGSRFRNTNTKPFVMEIFANGRWSLNGGTSYCGAGGYPDSPSATSDYRLPGKPLGALIVRRGNGKYEFVGGNRTLRLDPKESVYFCQNDNDGGYGDNVGTVKIEWTGDYEDE